MLACSSLASKCRTIFFIDARSGRLGLFYTDEPRYVEAHGVHVGMPTRTAEPLVQRRVSLGCIASIDLRTPQAELRLVFAGGAITRAARQRGGHVAALVLHGAKHDPGVFECT